LVGRSQGPLSMAGGVALVPSHRQSNCTGLRDPFAVLMSRLTKSLTPSKLPAGVLILFILKLDRTIRLYINYRGLNKVIIKNRYLLLLVSKMLD
jgi:hypothetical protein